MSDRPNLDSLSMLDDVGHRRTLHPADVRGRFRRAKPLVFGALILLFVALPLIDIGGHPAVLIDIPRRQFFLFGGAFNAQDIYLLFFVLIAIGLSLIIVSAMWGRIWCGWACPQTVFLDGVFRRVERWIEGDRVQRMRLAAAPWTPSKIARKGLLHSIYLLASAWISLGFLSYFVPAGELLGVSGAGPAGHPTAVVWAAVMTGILYFNFWWFREQLCIVICPYGRLQSVLQDQDTLIIGYDANRGEPRGKKSDPGAGDCVDCNRCVVVCPTGIDIRHGLQLECIGCAYCIDACDEIMHKLHRPAGLVRYDSERGLHTGERLFWRPRVFVYLGVAIAITIAASLVFRGHDPFAANVLRVAGAPYTVIDDTVHNPLRLHITHTGGDEATFSVTSSTGPPITVTLPQPTITLDAFASHEIPVLVSVARDQLVPGTSRVELIVRADTHDHAVTLSVPILGPGTGTAAGAEPTP